MIDVQLDLLYEPAGLERFPLPPALGEAYGGTLGFAPSCVFANFVSTIDGVVAIPSLAASNRLIAGASRADRFVMGLLRASSDAVVIGAGTLAGSPNSTWTPARAYPEAASGFAELRRRLGRDGEPELVVLSARGSLDPGHPALAEGALILSTELGSERLRARLPAGCDLVAIGPGPQLDAHAIIAALRQRGHGRILSEGGPHAIAPLLEAGLVDELFLTISPLLLGRTPTEERLALVEGADLLNGEPPAAQLLGVRRADAHLFLRYALGRRGPGEGLSAAPSPTST
jgi:riboflavin biosynthesis pyrimidine reductase